MAPSIQNYSINHWMNEWFRRESISGPGPIHRMNGMTLWGYFWGPKCQICFLQLVINPLSPHLFCFAREWKAHMRGGGSDFFPTVKNVSSFFLKGQILSFYCLRQIWPHSNVNLSMRKIWLMGRDVEFLGKWPKRIKMRLRGGKLEKLFERTFCCWDEWTLAKRGRRPFLKG